MKLLNKFKKPAAAISVWVATFTLLFAQGCTNDFKEELDDLKERVTDIEAALDALEAKFDGGLLVTDVVNLPDGNGYTITFSDGSSIEIYQGVSAISGQTPEIKVDAEGDVWINGTKTETNVAGQGVAAPRFKFEESAGELSVHYTISPANTAEGDIVWTEIESGIAAPAGDNPLLAVIIDDYSGSVTFVMNNEAMTQLTFSRVSSVHSLVVITDVVAFSGSESVEVKFRVNPSTAWIPTGTDDAIARWTLDLTGTRASYTNPSEAFSITSIEPDGDKTGQYVAIITADASKHDPEVSEYLMALVLDNGSDGAETLISSEIFRVVQSGAILTTVNYSNRIYYDDYWKNGTAQFDLRFLSVNWNDSNATGYDITVSFTSPPVSDSFDKQYIQIPDGTYDLNGDTDAWSIYLCDIWEFEDGTPTFYTLYKNTVEGRTIEGGTMTVTGEGSTKYNIVFSIDVGDKTIFARYVGDIFVDNPYYWSYTEDINVEFTHAYTQQTRVDNGYFGDAYGTGASNFRMFFHDYDMDDPSSARNGWELGIDLQTASLVDDGVYVEFLDIPAGTYTFDTSKAPGTIVIGGNTYIVEVKNNSGGLMAPITGGTATVSGNSAGYNMTFDIDLASGNTFRANYEGPLVIKNPLGLPPLNESLAAPTNLEVSRISPVGGTLAWDNAGSDGWIFRIQGKLTQSTEGLTNEYVEFWYNIGTPGYAVDGLLLPNETYTWQVANIYGQERSAWTEGPSFTTTPLGNGGDLGTFTAINQLEYRPDFWGNGTVDAWMLRAGQSGLSFEEGTVKGDGWMIEALIHVPLNAGPYMIPRDYPINTSYERFTVLSGLGYGMGGTMLYLMENDALVRNLSLTSGTMTIAFNGVYTAKFDATDSLGDKYTFEVALGDGAPMSAAAGRNVGESGYRAFDPNAARSSAPVMEYSDRQSVHRPAIFIKEPRQNTGLAR